MTGKQNALADVEVAAKWYQDALDEEREARVNLAQKAFAASRSNCTQEEIAALTPVTRQRIQQLIKEAKARVS